ncbi:hypothetical protein [Archangium lansingense]|uniref:Lipoprotein n=1 Tax=Archangium lansingense TaxID=2995310 RepID=A0ABT4AJS0_9BACT|nr:hypothetical protein [Archangium lansinium]MCY1081944.1 hypothetical protein [Archangium lansinium]
MPWPIRGFLGAAALVVLTSCGVSEDEIVHVKEGAKLGHSDPRIGLQYCTTLGCPDPALLSPPAEDTDPLYCLEVFFEYGRSPALCLPLDVCQKLECAKQGQECAIFDGFPGQVKCIEPKD